MAWKISKFADTTTHGTGRKTATYESSTEGPMRIEYTANSNLSSDSKLQRCLGDPETESNWSDSMDIYLTGSPSGEVNPVLEIPKSNMGPFLRLSLKHPGKTPLNVTNIKFSEFIKE